MKTSVIDNSFTGYSAIIRTEGMPAVSTIRKHLRAAKAQGCASVTRILINERHYDLADVGRGMELIPQ